MSTERDDTIENREKGIPSKGNMGEGADTVA